MTAKEKLKTCLLESGIGFSADTSNSFIGVTRGDSSITLNPKAHKKVEGFADVEIEFVFSGNSLIGVRINDVDSYEDHNEVL